jgi:hypothetical protein
MGAFQLQDLTITPVYRGQKPHSGIGMGRHNHKSKIDEAGRDDDPARLRNPNRRHEPEHPDRAP